MPDSESGQERLARVETKVEVIEKGIDIIRSTGHAINGEMQKFVAAEQRCVDSLAQIMRQTAGLPELIFGLREFTELKPKIAELVAKQERRHGAWASWIIAGSALAGAVAIVAGIVEIGIALWKH